VHTGSSRFSRYLCAMAVASAAIANPSLAQEPAPAIERREWTVSLGADLFQSTGSPVFSENFTAAIGREWTRANSGLSFRTQLAGGALPSTHRFLRPDCGNCFMSSKNSFVELSSTVHYNFRRNRNVRPYLLAGPALYVVRSKLSVTGAVLPQPGPNTATMRSIGATAGAGLNFSLFGTSLYLEQRIFTPDAASSTGKLTIRPFVLGIKF
jgi:hypothetical protein